MGFAAPARGRLARAVVTFDGTSGKGLAATNVVVFTITGVIAIDQLVVVCRTGLAGATATLTLGTASATAHFIAATLATDLVANDIWDDATPTSNKILDISTATLDFAGRINANDNIVSAVATANITSGVLDYYMRYEPLSADAVVSSTWPAA